MPAKVMPVEDFTAYCSECEWESEIINSESGAARAAEDHNNEHPPEATR